MGLTNKLGQLSQSIQQDASNNIGIGGAVNASYKLTVTGGLRVDSSASGGGYGGVIYNSSSTGQGLTIRGGFTSSQSALVVQNYDGSSTLLNVLSTGAATFSSSVNLGTALNSTTAAMVVENAGIYGSWIELKATSTGGKRWIVQSTGVSAGEGAGKFVINNATDAINAVVINSSGNVGIGTSSPSQILDIVGTTPMINIQAGANTNARGIQFNYNGSTIIGSLINYGATGENALSAGSSGTSGYFLTFKTDGSERMRITSGGDAQFKGNSGSASFLFSRVYSNNQPGLSLFNIAGTEVFYVNGNNGGLGITGPLSKGSGSFKIDHPLESLTETNYLVHSFIEGPKADLIYRGKLNLINGKAQANIDKVSTMTEGTFEVLCREVQCFTTNESGWDLVKGKVIGNIIYIESQNTNSTDEISWMVIGERKDKHMIDTSWTDENGKVIVEPLKPIGIKP